MEKNTVLKALRVLRGMNQEQLAALVGRSRSWLCGVELGRIEPDDRDLASLTRALGVTPGLLSPGSQESIVIKIERGELCPQKAKA